MWLTVWLFFLHLACISGTTPTVSPSLEPTVTATPTITCTDRDGWYKKGSPKKTCSWVAAYPQNRCKRKGEDGTKAFVGCAGTCAGIRTNDNSCTNTSNTCKNDDSWYVANNPRKDCDWVSTHWTTRCSRLGEDDTRASEGCRKVCGTCGCSDSSTWKVKTDTNNAGRGCSWVAKYSEGRCSRIGEDDTDGYTSCPVTCLSC